MSGDEKSLVAAMAIWACFVATVLWYLVYR